MLGLIFVAINGFALVEYDVWGDNQRFTSENLTIKYSGGTAHLEPNLNSNQDKNYIDPYYINVALSTNPDSADKDRVTWAASTLSKEFLNLTSYDGAIYNKNTPMEPRDFLIKMQDIAKKRDIHSIYTQEYQDFNKLPDDLNAQYEFAKSHGNNTVNNKLGTMASRLVSQNRITKDEYAELNDDEKKEADELMQAETTTPRVKELKDIAEKRKTVREYQNQLRTENAWAIAAGVKAALNEEGQGILERALNNLDNIENTVGLEFMAFADKNPQEAKMLAVALHAIQPQPENSAIGDGLIALWEGLDIPLQAIQTINNIVERSFVNADTYQKNREKEAIIRRAFKSKKTEHGWWGNMVVRFFSTIPYMAYATSPYGV